MTEENLDAPLPRPPGPLRCPKCLAQMTTVQFAGTEVDRCPDCGGLWFDLLEHEDLRDQPGAASIDTGDPALGQRYDRQGLIRCPLDAQPMVRMVDKGQPSLWLESCPLCHGMFFDAGEFRNFTDESVRDLVFRRRRQRPM